MLLIVVHNSPTNVYLTSYAFNKLYTHLFIYTFHNILYTHLHTKYLYLYPHLYSFTPPIFPLFFPILFQFLFHNPSNSYYASDKRLHNLNICQASHMPRILDNLTGCYLLISHL
jgi:hypothetical protein